MAKYELGANLGSSDREILGGFPLEPLREASGAYSLTNGYRDSG